MCKKLKLSELELIQHCRKTFDSRKKAAAYLGVTYSWYNQLCQKHGLGNGLIRSEYKKRIAKYNEENGTSFVTTSDIVRALYDSGMSKQAIAEKIGVSIKTVYGALGDHRDSETPEERETTPKPDNYDLPYVGGAHPCLSCDIHTGKIDKTNYWCRNCGKRVAYAIAEGGGIPTNGTIEPSNCQVQHTFREYSMMP
jgi:hypothetical protein